MKKYIQLTVLLALTFTVKSQILTIDKTDTSDYSKKTVCKGNIAIGFEGDKQKALLLDATNTLDLQLQHYKELLIFALSYRFTYNGKQDFLNSGFVHLRWRHVYKNTWQPETFTQIQWDQSRGMLQRFVAGENLRYNFWHRKEWEISVATGVMYESEKWNYAAVDSALKPAVQTNQVTGLLKSNNYFRWEGKLSDNTNLSVVLFYQSPFSHLFSRYRFATSTRFDFTISKHFNFGVTFNSMYDSKPVVPIMKFYYNFSNALVYNF